MPLTYAIRDGILSFETVGDVEFDEGIAVLREGVEAYLGQEPRQPLLRFDLRRSTEDRSADEIRAIATRLGADVRGGRLALIVSEPIYFGLSRMFSAYVEQHGFHAEVFTDGERADAWLREAPET